LDAAIARVCNRRSLYWSFRDVPFWRRGKPVEIEIRIDVPVDAIDRRAAPAGGWKISNLNLDDEMMFFRRTQPLTNRALREMFAEALTFADIHQGRFHSWLHAPGLPDWPSHSPNADRP